MAGLDEARRERGPVFRRRPRRSRVRFTGMLPRDEYRALLRRARVFVTAPRREDYGIAQLEALADGCLLVTTPSPGPTRRCRSRASSTRGSSAASPARSGPRSTTRRPATPSAPREHWRRGGPRRSTRSCASSCSRGCLARMTLAGQSVLITGAAHGIGAETARRLAARGARVSLVGLGDLAAVAADCPGSVDLRGRRHRPRGARRRRRRRGRGVRRHRHRVRHRRSACPASCARMDPGSFERVIEVNLIGVWRTIRACLPHVIERRGYILPGRVDGGDPAAGRAGRLRRGEVGRRGLGHALRVETQALRRDVGVAYFSWIDTEMVRGADRTELGAAPARAAHGPARETFPVSAAAEAVVRGIERRSRIVACRAADPLMGLKPILPRLTERGCARTSPVRELAVREAPRARTTGRRRRRAELAARGNLRASPACAAARTPPTGACWHLLRRQPGAAGGRDPVPQRAEVGAVRVGVDEDAHAGLRRRAGVDVVEVAPVGRRVDLQHRPGARGRLDHALHVDRVGRRASRSCGRSGGRSRRRSGCSIAATMRSVISRLAHPERGVHGGDHPVELREQLVLVVERAVGVDVGLGARQQLDAVERGVERVDALDLRRSSSGVTSLPKPWEAEWSVIARYS